MEARPWRKSGNPYGADGFMGGEAFREEMLVRIGERMESRKRESYSGEEVKGHGRKRADELLRK